MKNTILVIFIFFLLSNLAFGQDNQLTVPEHTKYYRILKEAEAPILDGKSLFLTYKGSKPIRYIAAAFDYENYTVKHYFIKNGQGLYFLKTNLPQDRFLKEIKYRIIIDGLWTYDNKNSNIYVDEQNITYSVLDVRNTYQKISKNPILSKDGTYKFYFKAPMNVEVYIVGDFNNWNAFELKLEPDAEYKDYHSIILPIALKEINYYYLVNGKIYLDPINLRKSYNSFFARIEGEYDYNLSYFKK